MSINISASLLNDYISCSRKAYYRVFKRDVAVPNKYMIMGTIVHDAIEKYWDNKDRAFRYVTAQTDERNLSNETDNLLTYVDTYFNEFSKFIRKGDLIEKFFKLKMDNGVYLVGKFDRVSNGVIYDWKTSSKPPRNLENDVQFIIYYHAYRKMYKKPPTAAFYASLAQGRLIPYSYNEFYYNELFNGVIPDLINDIKSKNFNREGIFKKGTCYFCSYKEDCLKGLNDGMDGRSFAEE